MSDDLVSRLRQQAHNRAERSGGGHQVTVEWKAAQALTEARAEIEKRDAAYMRAVESRTEWRARAEKAESELSTLRARVREVVAPFAKAGELFGPRLSDEYDQCIYSPASGDEYKLSGDHLRAARKLVEDLT